MNYKLLFISGAVLAVVLILAKKFAIKKPGDSPSDKPDETGEDREDFNMGFTLPNESDLQSAFRKVAEKYGNELAKNAERIYRLETAHFNSGQFKATNSPGMLKFSTYYPYGWQAPRNLWDQNPQYKPIGQATFTKNGKQYTYLKFPNFEAALFTLAEYLNKYRPGRWYSTVPAQQNEYETKLKSISTKYT